MTLLCLTGTQRQHFIELPRWIMTSQDTRRRPRTDEDIKLTPLNADEQAKRIQQAISRRAYEIFRRRGCAPLHELEDWHQAESELVQPCCCGSMALNGDLWLGTDASRFDEGTIEVWLAPRRITICGKLRTGKKRTGSDSQAQMIYRVVDLPLEVDPLAVTTQFNGPSLEIVLRKAQARPVQDMAVVA